MVKRNHWQRIQGFHHFVITTLPKQLDSISLGSGETLAQAAPNVIELRPHASMEDSESESKESIQSKEDQLERHNRNLLRHIVQLRARWHGW